MFSRESEANAGDLLGKKTNKHEKTAAELPKNEENLKGLMFQWVPNLLIGLRNHCYVQQKEDQLFVTEKNNERNQKLSGEWVGERVQ